MWLMIFLYYFLPLFEKASGMFRTYMTKNDSWLSRSVQRLLGRESMGSLTGGRGLSRAEGESAARRSLQSADELRRWWGTFRDNEREGELTSSLLLLLLLDWNYSSLHFTPVWLSVWSEGRAVVLSLPGSSYWHLINVDLCDPGWSIGWFF